VSPDDCLRHADFRDQNGVSIRLLADTESEVCRKYGVVHEKEANGSTKSCITRSTFIIDKRGTVRHVFYGVNPAAMPSGCWTSSGRCVSRAPSPIRALEHRERHGRLARRRAVRHLGRAHPALRGTSAVSARRYGNIFPAAEAALEGKRAKDRVEVRLEPEDAFGDYDENLLRVEPRSRFPETLEIGMRFEGQRTATTKI